MSSVKKKIKVIDFCPKSTGKAQLQLDFRTRNEFIPGCDLGNLTKPLPFKIVSEKIPLIWGSNRKKKTKQCTI